MIVTPDASVLGNTLARRSPNDVGALLASLSDFDLTEARLHSDWRIRAVPLSEKYRVIG